MKTHPNSAPSSAKLQPPTTSKSSESAQSPKAPKRSAKQPTKRSAKNAPPRMLHGSSTIISPADLKGDAPVATEQARAQALRVQARRRKRELKPTLRGTPNQSQQMPDQIGAVMGPYLLS